MAFLITPPAPGILPLGSVSFPEIENMPNNHLLGNNTGSEGPALSLDADEATALLSPMGAASISTGGAKGLVPASSAGDQLKFLRADGNWAQGTPVFALADAGKVLATDGTDASWRYAGLGDGSFPANTIILGRAKPAGLTGSPNIIISPATSGGGITTGTRNVVISDTGASSANYSSTVIIGTNISSDLSGSESVYVGTQIDATTTIYGNVAIGFGASPRTHSENVLVGRGTSVYGANNVVVGSQAENQAQNGVVVGYQAFGRLLSTVVGSQSRADNFNTVVGANSFAKGWDSLTIGHSSGTNSATPGDNNTVVGNYSFNSPSLTSAANNTIVGHTCGRGLTTGSLNVLIGKGVANALTGGSKNVIIGSTATNLVNPDEAVVIGHNNQPIGTPTNCTIVGSNNTGSYRTTLIGTGNSGTGENQILIGRGNIGGSASHSIGIGLGISCDGQTAIAIGHYASARGTGQIAVGDQASARVDHGIAIGSSAGSTSVLPSPVRSIVIGAMSNTGSGGENIVLGQNSKAGPATFSFAGGSKNIVIGHQIGNALTTGGSNTIISTEGPNALTTGSNNTIVGQGSGAALTTGFDNVIVGQGCGTSLTTGNQNCLYGVGAGVLLNSVQRVNCFGFNAGGSQTTGGFSVYVGAYSGYGSVLGSYNTAVGDTAMYNNPGGVGMATCIGYASTAGDFAVSVGAQSSGSGIAIGHSCNSGAPGNIVIGRGGGGDYYQGNNGLCIGSTTHPINRVFLGMGGTNAANTALQAVQIRTSNVIGGADKEATLGTLTLSGNQGTGSGLGSDVIISTSPVGAPGGTTPNAYVERFRVTATGIVKTSCGEKHASIHGLTANHNATINNYYIGVDTSSAAITVKLPAAGTAGQGFVMVIKDETGNAATASRNITVDGDGSNIDGAPTQTINTNYGSVSLMCSGSAWFIM